MPALLFLILILILAPPPTSGPSSRPTSKPVDWFAMTPDEFAACADAKRPLPWGGVDDRLLSAAILHETNRFRTENKMPTLRHMPKVVEVAAMHAADMAEGGWFGHENASDPKKHTVVERVRLLKLNPMFAGENIVMEYGIRYEVRRRVFDVTRGGRKGISYEQGGELIPPRTYHEFGKQVCQRWMDSPAHRTNMLTPHAKFLGAAARPGKSADEIRFRKFYVAQVFFAPMPR